MSVIVGWSALDLSHTDYSGHMCVCVCVVSGWQAANVVVVLPYTPRRVSENLCASYTALMFWYRCVFAFTRRRRRRRLWWWWWPWGKPNNHCRHINKTSTRGLPTCGTCGFALCASSGTTLCAARLYNATNPLQGGLGGGGAVSLQHIHTETHVTVYRLSQSHRAQSSKRTP